MAGSDANARSKGESSAAVDDLADNLEKVKLQSNTDGEIPVAEDAPKALREFASWIKTGSVKNILVVTGAGISVSAGIPDFRTPGTGTSDISHKDILRNEPSSDSPWKSVGLYDNLQKYNLPYPEAVFDLDFFGRNPKPFVTLAKELWPTGLTFQPTLTHSFLTLLARKNLLLRVYSQNIDGLEHLGEYFQLVVARL